MLAISVAEKVARDLPTLQDIEILKTVDAAGAITEDELAVSLGRPDEDILPQLEELIESGLVQSRRVPAKSGEVTVFLVGRDVDRTW